MSTEREHFHWSTMFTVARTDLKQLVQAKDFWLPMILLGSFFFVIIPAILLLTITEIGSVETVQKVSQSLDMLPPAAQAQIEGNSPEGRTGYALAVFLFAPVAVIVPRKQGARYRVWISIVAHISVSSRTLIAAAPMAVSMRAKGTAPCRTPLGLRCLSSTVSRQTPMPSPFSTSKPSSSFRGKGTRLGVIGGRLTRRPYSSGRSPRKRNRLRGNDPDVPAVGTVDS